MTAGGKPGNPKTGFPPFPPSLEIAERFPHFHRLDDSLIIKPERKTLLRKVLPMSSDRSVTYVPGRTAIYPRPINNRPAGCNPAPQAAAGNEKEDRSG
jgi:hypothetical protein